MGGWVDWSDDGINFAQGLELGEKQGRADVRGTLESWIWKNDECKMNGGERWGGKSNERYKQISLWGNLYSPKNDQLKGGRGWFWLERGFGRLMWRWVTSGDYQNLMRNEDERRWRRHKFCGWKPMMWWIAMNDVEICNVSVICDWCVCMVRVRGGKWDSFEHFGCGEIDDGHCDCDCRVCVCVWGVDDTELTCRREGDERKNEWGGEGINFGKESIWKQTIGRADMREGNLIFGQSSWS